LNGIPHGVHWIRKRPTPQLEWLSIGSSICDGDTVSIPSQIKVMEADFDDVPTGNCDIPDTSAVLRVVAWKIGAGNISTCSSNKFFRCTSRDYASVVDLDVSCPKTIEPIIVTIRDKQHLQDFTK